MRSLSREPWRVFDVRSITQCRGMETLNLIRTSSLIDKSGMNFKKSGDSQHSTYIIYSAYQIKDG